jgi:hypothetical protein
MSFNRARILALVLLALAWGIGTLRPGPPREGSDDRLRQRLAPVERSPLPARALDPEEEQHRFVIVGGAALLVLLALMATARPAR